MLNALIAALILVVAQPVIAGQMPSSPSPSPRFGALRPAPAQPYKNLFKPATALPVAAPPAVTRDSSKPTVVCGMIVVPADPTIDPKIVVPRSSNGTRYTIRAIDPPVCR